MIRKVSSTTRDGMALKKVTLIKPFKVTSKDLWEAVTNKDRLAFWFLPVSGELKPSGCFQIEGNANGSILTCNSPTHLSITWEFGGGISWVNLYVNDDEKDGVCLTLDHDVPIDDHWNQYGPGATGVGWDLTLIGLDSHLSSDECSFNTDEWAVTEDGKKFIRNSSEDWMRAQIESGELETVAQEQANKTTAFYTGETE